MSTGTVSWMMVILSIPCNERTKRPALRSFPGLSHYAHHAIPGDWAGSVRSPFFVYVGVTDGCLTVTACGNIRARGAMRHIIVDGYNVIRADSRLQSLERVSLEHAREVLVRTLASSPRLANDDLQVV